MPDAWSMKGEYFEACNCDVACPCVFLSDPTQDTCTVLLGYHVEKGKSGTHSLDGLSFAIAAFCRGNMLKNKWEGAIYLDQHATEVQRRALETILTGQAGGVFGVLAPFFGKVHGIRSVPIEFHVDGKKRSMKIPGVAEMRVQALTTSDGKEVKITNAPFGAAADVSVAKSERLIVTDYGWKWDVAEKNSFFAPFSAHGP
ncbi:MAG: DUF1326 domain-containing protein [Thermoplasmata archaeon]|nr:DUF1326 domain-containing protein [Thermoplasmata archaeon]